MEGMSTRSGGGISSDHHRGNGGGVSSPVSSSPMMEAPEGFPEIIGKAPLHPQMDDEKKLGVYQWGNNPLPQSRISGVKAYTDSSDNQNHQAVKLPWPADARVFHPNSHPETDRINTSYSAMLSDELPEGGFGGERRQQQQSPSFESSWERLLAYHHGLYDPTRGGETRSADDIRLAVNRFSERAHLDDPKGACKYLLIEEYKCLQTHQVEVDPDRAATKCVKWFDQWRQCQWDEEKMKKGYSFIDMRPPRKRKPYIAAPDHQFS